MRTKLTLTLGLLTFALCLSAFAQGTAFTYQGRLDSGGNPANGIYDLRFALYDAAGGGSQQGNTLTNTATAVSNGLFTVTLDFGGKALDGSALWLEIAVRPGASVGSFTNLAPRQPLTATPYAVRAANFSGTVDAAQLTGTIAPTNIGGVLAPAQIPNLDAGKIATGTLPIARLPESGNWPLTAPFSFNAPTLVIDPVNNRVGIGANSPAVTLDVAGRIVASSSGPTIQGTKTGTGTFPGVYGITESTSADAAGVRGFVTSTNSGARSAGVWGRNYNIGSNGYGVRGDHDGIGYGVYGETLNGRGVSGRATATSGVNFGVYGQSDSVNGIGIYGSNERTSGINYGVYGITASRDGSGIYGLNTAMSSSSTDKKPSGVTGLTTFSGGVGVWGEAIADSDGKGHGVLGTTRVWGGDGVRGEYKSTTTFPGYGAAVAGYNYTAGGYAGYFVGRPTYCSELEAFKLGVRRTPVSNDLEVEGTASKSNAGSWLANSDARIKQEVETVTDALDLLNRVRLVSFRYEDDYLAQHPVLRDRRYLNVIAQEFAEVFPDHVQSSGEKLPDGSDILQVDIHPLTIYSAAAIQELSAKINSGTRRAESLEQRLAQKETEITELNARLKKLEQLLEHKLNGGGQ